jgi:hypothetical protein
MIQYQALSKRRLPNMVHVSLLHNEKKDLTVMVNNSTNMVLDHPDFLVPV